MNNLKLIITLIFLQVCIVSLHAQSLIGDFVCDTEIDSIEFVDLPYYGNERYLIEIDSIVSIASDSLYNANGRSDISYSKGEALFNIPIKLWLYHDDDGSKEAID